jgi:hypothetical protein
LLQENQSVALKAQCFRAPLAGLSPTELRFQTRLSGNRNHTGTHGTEDLAQLTRLTILLIGDFGFSALCVKPDNIVGTGLNTGTATDTLIYIYV